MKINIIGRGNVGTHLKKALSGKVTVSLIDSRTLSGLDYDSDVCLLCVHDAAIKEVADNVRNKVKDMCIVAHTSGSTPMGVLHGIKKRIGVFYPLQTFSKQTLLKYEDIPFLIEANDEDAKRVLIELAKTISYKVTEADSSMRKAIHIASVMSCNFVNHLWALSALYLKESNLDFSLLYPLLQETLGKAMTNDPSEVQTGPAARKDYITIKNHIESLKGNPKLQNIYETLSSSIIENGRNKL